MRFGITVALLVLPWFCFLLSSVVGQDECPEGFDRSFQNSCYKRVDSRINWENAERECNRAKSHLVYIESDEEQQFIANWQNNTDGPNSWIGLSQQENGDSDFMWSDGSPCSYTAWRSGAPTNNTDRNCVRLVKGQYYRWANRMCSEDNTYICETEVICCPSNWHFSDDFCYFVSEQTLTYNEARDECIKMHATLTSIVSQEDQYVHNRLAKMYDGDLWIGLNDKASENTWMWEDQSRFDFTNWADGEPNDYGGEDCVVLRDDYNGKWNDEGCNDEYRFICKRATACPIGWYFYNNSCYFVEADQTLTYDEARDACLNMNTTLTSISNSNDQYVHTRFLTAYNKDLWIGLNDKISERDWQWEDESNYVFWNWDGGQPDNANNEDCVHLWIYKDGRWNDNQCNAQMGYICKQALPTATTPVPMTTPAEMTTTIIPGNPATTTSPSNHSEVVTSPSDQPEHPTTTDPSTTNIEGTRQQQKSGLKPGAIAGVVIGIIFLLLMLLILVLTVFHPRRKTKTKQEKQGTTTLVLLNGTSVQTSNGTSSHTKQSTVQQIYTDSDDKKQNQYVNSAFITSSGVTESSTDEIAGVVFHYEDVSKCEVNRSENQRAVVNDNDQETSLYYAKSDTPQFATKNIEEIAVDQQYDVEHERLYYAKSDSNSETNNLPHISKEQESNLEDSDSLYYATSNLNPESDGHPLSKAQQESCPETSLYYAKSNGDINQSPGDDSITGWEENAAYSSYGDNVACASTGWVDNTAYSSKDESALGTTVSSDERKGNYDALHDSKYSQDSKQEGWAECALYGESKTDGADDDKEEWAENTIYAGSDSES